MNITWKIEQLACYPESNNVTDVVFSAAWRVNGELVEGANTYTATVYGSQGLNPYEEGLPFTPYAQLTQAQVVGWVQDVMGEEQVAAIEANLTQQIADQINPPVLTPTLPWAAA